MSDPCARREQPRITILDERFETILTDARGEHAGAFFRSTARRIVEREAQSEDVEYEGRHYVVRVVKLAGGEALRYAMFVEARGARQPLLDAYTRFGLSPREVDVLSLIIDGATNREIAEALSIVESTVEDHVRSITRKSGAAARGALLARVFDVDETAPGNDAPP